MEELPLSDPAAHEDLSPEARRRRALRWQDGLQEAIGTSVGPGTRAFIVVKRVFIGAYFDGFIHAGNLAYMAMLALFPFFVTMTAVFTLLGEASQREASVHALLTALPPMVASVLEPVARSVVSARSGWLLWAGGLVGLWTVTSLIETIRDILHRAYGTPVTQAFWRYRLLSSAFIFGAVVTLLFSLFLQVAVTGVQEMIAAWFPRLSPDAMTLATTRILPGLVLYLSIFMLFLSLTPSAYRGDIYPKWPGALLVTVWWSAVSIALPGILHRFFTYDLTYGSLAGVMITLFFFWLVGLGMVIGAELNAALAESPEERDMLGQADNRERKALAEQRNEGP
ncbi:MAG: YihY/virulence factor BrkB family protein [Novosphingobium sp.]